MGIKQVTNVNWVTVGSVVVGMAAFGAIIYTVSRLPSNSVTQPVKAAANIVNT